MFELGRFVDYDNDNDNERDRYRHRDRQAGVEHAASAARFRAPR
jgi:hypothetical protein